MNFDNVNSWVNRRVQSINEVNRPTFRRSHGETGAGGCSAVLRHALTRIGHEMNTGQHIAPNIDLHLVAARVLHCY